jgi:hypothetical protein
MKPDIKKIILTSIFILITVWVNAQFCNKYADKAVAQYKLAKSNNLPDINWPVWSDDWKGHYNWCKTVSEDIANKETARRQAYLDKYNKGNINDATRVILNDMVKNQPKMITMQPAVTSQTNSKNTISEYYAKESVRQNKVNISNNCGFKGPSWSSDYNAHKNWCLHGDNYLQVDRILAEREKQLKTCSGGSYNPKVAGAVHKIEPGSIKLEINFDRPGKDYKNFYMSDFHEFSYRKCLKACINDVKCKSFTFMKSGIQSDKAQCYLKNGVPALIKKENYISGIVRPDTKTDYCNNYAQDAITSINNNCGYKGDRWVDDFKKHYDFCMKVSEQRSIQETSERKRLLANCNQPTKSGDLMAYDMCYDVNLSDGEITFYPIIKNIGATNWKSEKEGSYGIHSIVGRGTSEHFFKIPNLHEGWSLNKDETYKLEGISFPYSPSNTYTLAWELWHDEDTNVSNNSKSRAFDSFGDRIKGINFAEHPWLLSHKKCKKEPMYWPLNLHWDTTDLNNIPLNPLTEWQIKHQGNYQNHYPDISQLAPLLKTRIFGIYNIYTKKLGEERDFSKATNQPIFKEYGGAYIPGGDNYILGVKQPDIDVSGIVGKCGPHVNWKQPVTYEGYLVGGKYDQDDKDLNFYLYPPEGAGASKTSHLGGLKVEFSRLETIDLLSSTSPWWTSNKSKFLSENTLDQIIDSTYAIVTAMYGYDCAHECHSELHSAWTMAARVKDNPKDDTYAIFARNWGNEGFCSDHIFHLYLPKEGNQFIYKFLLPWRPGAESVTFKSIFNQKDGVTLDITPVSQKGVIVSFGFPSPDIRPFIIGELHLVWNYPSGLSPQPYPDLKDAGKNASSASKAIVLEDTEMVDDIIKNLPQDKKQLFRKYIDEVNKTTLKSFDGQIPSILYLDKSAIERINSTVHQVRIIKDFDKMNRKKSALKKLSIDEKMIKEINTNGKIDIKKQN